MDKKRGIKIIINSSIIAIIISIYLLYLHYSDTSSFCDISKGLSCDIVNRSLYSEIFNIPISLLSILMFAFILIISIYIKNNKEFSGFNKKELINMIYYLMIFNLLFSLYLVYIEAFVLYSFCVLCTLLDIIILIILITIIRLKREK